MQPNVVPQFQPQQRFVVPYQPHYPVQYQPIVFPVQVSITAIPGQQIGIIHPLTGQIIVATVPISIYSTGGVFNVLLDEYEQKFDRLEQQQINYNSTVAINGNNNNVNIMNVQPHPMCSAYQLPQFTQPMGMRPEMWTQPMNHQTLGMASMNQATTQQLDAQASTAMSSSLIDPPIQIDEERIESKMKEFELSRFGGMKMNRSWLANYKKNYMSIKSRRGGITAWIDGQRRQKAGNSNSELGVLRNELLELLGI